jgi:hypothetical protein
VARSRASGIGSVGSINWAPDGRSLLVTAQDTLDTPLFRVDIGQRPGEPADAGGTVGNATPLARRFVSIHAEQPSRRRTICGGCRARRPRRSA